MHLREATGLVEDLLWPCWVLQPDQFVFHSGYAVRKTSWLLKAVPSLLQGAVSGLWVVVPSCTKPLRQPDSWARNHP